MNIVRSVLSTLHTRKGFSRPIHIEVVRFELGFRRSFFLQQPETVDVAIVVPCLRSIGIPSYVRIVTRHGQV